MKAIGVNRGLPTTHPECFIKFNLDLPQLGKRDLSIEVKAISVNPVDYKVRSSIQEKLDLPRILGWDAAGIVIEIGSEVTLFKPGDRVYYAGSITRPGCNSEYHLVDERIVGRMPQQLSFGEAAALPLTTITAWEALFDRMQISPNPIDNTQRSILIIGGAGGVGSIAIQLAKKVAGLKVIATASRDESRKWCLEMGADIWIDRHEKFRTELAKFDLTAVDYILCCNDTDAYWENMADIIAPQGKICSIVETKRLLDLKLIKNKSVTFVWEFMFTRAMYQTEDMQAQHELLNRVAELVDRGILQTTMTENLGSLNAQNLANAHARLESGETIGKLVLSAIEK
jgi:NADPH:quinone reductase